jgi:hypothetical protein
MWLDDRAGRDGVDACHVRELGDDKRQLSRFLRVVNRKRRLDWKGALVESLLLAEQRVDAIQIRF